MKREWTVPEAARVLQGKGVRIEGTTLRLDTASSALGNGSWGAVDYLMKCGFAITAWPTPTTTPPKRGIGVLSDDAIRN